MQNKKFTCCSEFYNNEANWLVKDFITYILPVVSYCSVVWSPYLRGDIDAIESVQKLFTKRIPELNKLSYSQRLIAFNLPSLERRRLYADLMFCFKILMNFTNLEPGAFGLNRASGLTSATTRGHPYKLLCDHNRINVRKYFFANRVIDPWLISSSLHLFLLVVFVVAL